MTRDSNNGLNICAWHFHMIFADQKGAMDHEFMSTIEICGLY